MKSKLNIPFILLIVMISVLISCKKDKANPEKEQKNLPYSQYMQTSYGSYVEVPHDPALNLVHGITLEGWVRMDNTAGSNVFFKKKLSYKEEGYFVEVREQDGKTWLYSYMGYDGAKQHAGNPSIHEWFHFAVTSDGHVRKHYMNGELMGKFDEDADVFTPSSEPLFIAKTVPARTGLAEFRLWNTARTQAEIKKTMMKDIVSPLPGLVAVWPFEENAKDVIGGHNGVLHNNPGFLKWSN